MSKLLWSEEFDYTGLPQNELWNFVVAGNGFGNDELQYYTDRPENVWVSDGTLKINLLLEDYENREYTSARINTSGKYSFTHGRAEIKAKIPRGKGVWPAIWMLGDAVRNGIGWPECGEIDIMEHTGTNQDNMVFSLHSKEHNHRLSDSQTTTSAMIEGVSDDFHIYEVIRKPSEIIFLVDKKEYARFHENDCKSWPFDKPFFFIVNVACGGFFGGPVDKSVLPQTMEVEYIRVYEE